MNRETVLLFTAVMALVLVGVLVGYSTGAVLTADFGDPDHPDLLARLHRQLIIVGIAVAGMFAASAFNYRWWRKRFFLWAVAVPTLALLAMVLVIGFTQLGAARWIDAPFFGTMQPSEFAKVAMILWLAAKLSENQQDIATFGRGFLAPLCTIGLFAGLVVFQRDLGTPVIIATTGIIMMFIAGTRKRFLFGALGIGAGLATFLIFLEPYRLDRFKGWFDPWKYRSNEGYQVIESLTAFVRGGTWGVGVGAGEQKLGYLFAAESDFAFAICGEEMGLAGTLLVVALFALFLIAGRRVVNCAPDTHGTLLAAGIVTLIGLEAALNMGVTTGLLPPKGLGLPFVSAGGTALLVKLFLAGILLNIAQHAREDEPANVYAPISARSVRGAAA